MDCHILHTLLLVILLLLTIAIICHHYTKHRSKQKRIGALTMLENNESQKVCIKNCTCCYFVDIIEIVDFDFDKILLDENHKKVF